MHIEKTLVKLNGELLEKYNEIWGKVNNSIKNEFDSEKYLYTMKTIYKLKLNHMMEKLTQIFTIIKYQKKVFNLFVYQ